MYYTYIIQSDTSGLIYIGQTSDVFKRLARHNSGGSKFTKGKGSWSLIYYIESNTRSEAILLERKLKGFKSSKKVLIWIENQNISRGRPDN